MALQHAQLRALYPFISGETQDPARLDEALLRSIEEKAAESRATNMLFFAAVGAAR